MADQLRAGRRLALRLLGRRRTPRLLQAAPLAVHLHRVRPRSSRSPGCVFISMLYLMQIYFSYSTGQKGGQRLHDKKQRLTQPLTKCLAKTEYIKCHSRRRRTLHAARVRGGTVRDVEAKSVPSRVLRALPLPRIPGFSRR